MIKKTKDYDQFVFREDNREKVDNAHVRRLCESINARNLLEFRPIVVNKKMEVLDGQHRLLAARELGVEIYYQEEKGLDAEDIIRMNISKAWTLGDYLNFYCQHEYVHYMNLAAFMKKHQLSLRTCLSICIGAGHSGYTDFRAGEFKFVEDFADECFDLCWQTVDYIEKVNGHCPYVRSARFWRALLLLVKHPDFEEVKWRHNLERNISTVGPRANGEAFMILFENIYNWRNQRKIHLRGIPDIE